MEQINDGEDGRLLADWPEPEAVCSTPLTSVDITITDAIKTFYSSLTKSNRPGFRAQDINGKVNDICWEWASRPKDDPEAYRASVLLRASYFVHRMDTFIYQDGPDRPPHLGYSLDVLNPFWADVNEYMTPLLEDHITELTGNATRLRVYDEANVPVERPLYLASYLNHDIYKQLYVHREPVKQVRIISQEGQPDRQEVLYVAGDRAFVSRVDYFIAPQERRAQIDPYFG